MADVFENFRKIRNLFKNLEIYQLDLAKFLSALGLTWQAVLKRAKVKLELLTDIDKLFMVEKGIVSL